MEENALKEFHFLLQPKNQLPRDEMRDNYLANARHYFNHHQKEILDGIYQDKTCLFMVFEQIVKNTHPIRLIHLNLLAMQIIEKSSKEMLNYQNINGDSTIHLSTNMSSFSVGILDLMQERGADFGLINNLGETPLLKLATTDNLDDLKFIQQYTPKKLMDHQEKKYHDTALIKAVKGKKLNNIIFLIKAGASILIHNKDNKNAWLLFTESDYEKFFEDRNMKDLYEEVFFIMKINKSKEQKYR